MRCLRLSAVAVCAAAVLVMAGCSDEVTSSLADAGIEVQASKGKGKPAPKPDNRICRAHHSSDGPFLNPQYTGALQIFPQAGFERIEFGGGWGTITGPGTTVVLYFCEGGYCESGRIPDYNGEMTSVVVPSSGNYQLYHQLVVWKGSGYWGELEAPVRTDPVGRFLARTLVTSCAKLPCEFSGTSLDDWAAFSGDEEAFAALGFDGIMNNGCFRDPKTKQRACSKLVEEEHNGQKVVMFRPSYLIQGQLCWNDLQG
jgi:hypothetical protein